MTTGSLGGHTPTLPFLWVLILSNFCSSQDLGKAGIDYMFKPHSIWAASTSKAKKVGVPLHVIAKTAGWANAKVFSIHYDKPFKRKIKTVQEAILGSTRL